MSDFAFPPQFRVIGSKHDFVWKIPSGTSAIVDGSSSASYASIVGGESITIAVAGGAATPISFAAADNSQTGVIDRINATFAGLASARGNGVRLTDATSIAVSAYSSYADFQKIGIPIVTRDATAAAATPYRAPLTGDAVATRLDIISDVFTLPEGANAVHLLSRVTYNDTNGQLDTPVLLLFWETATDTLNTSVFDMEIDTVISQVTYSDTSPNGTVQYKFAQRTPPTVGVAGMLIKSVLGVIPAPPGATGLRVVLAGTDVPTGNTVPMTPEDVGVSVWAGAA